MPRWGAVAAAYALVGLFSLVVSVLVRGAWPFVHAEPWLALGAPLRELYGASVGAALGALVVLVSRASLRWFAWARELHGALRPFARGMTGPLIVVVAVLSATGEEILFRGLLQPTLGLVPQAVLFGLLHQVRGPSRWVFVAWATVMGLVLGGLFVATGTLLSPIAAHAVVNGLNLAFLKTHDASARPALGGLLGGSPRLGAE